MFCEAGAEIKRGKKNLTMMVLNDLLPWQHFSIDLANPHLLLHSPSLSLCSHFPPLYQSLFSYSLHPGPHLLSICLSCSVMEIDALWGYANLHLVLAYILLLLFQSVRLDPLLPASSINTFIQNLNPNPRRWFSKYFEVQRHNVIALLNVLMPKYRQTAGSEQNRSCSFQIILIHFVI